MHGCPSFVSSCGTVVYALNCENVHSSASDSGNIAFTGDISPQKYLYICWDFKMSQIELSLNFTRQVIPSLSWPTCSPQLGSS